MTTTPRSLPLLALALLLGAPPSAKAEVLWSGDFETGDISQWTRAQQISPDRLQIVQSPVHQGRYALRAEVVQGDDPINASGNRNELVRMTNEEEGQERYYAWSTLWPEDYPFTPTWQLFTQWHHSGSSGAPPVRFILGCSAADCGTPLPDTLFFIVTGQNVWTMRPVVRGVWHHFVLHVKWSSDPSVGFVELWHDGQQVVPKTFADTLFPGQTNYLKQGLYRDEATEPRQVVYHDGFVIGTTLADVAHLIAPASAATPPLPPSPEEPATPPAAPPTAGPIVPNDPPLESGEPQPTPAVGSDTPRPSGRGIVGCSVAPTGVGGALPGMSVLLVGLGLVSRGRRGG